MSDVENQPFFNIQRVYLKDMSLEQPNSPAIFLEQDMPSVEVEVDVKAERLAEACSKSSCRAPSPRRSRTRSRS
jgi:preprotein translocase subunit SecB